MYLFDVSSYKILTFRTKINWKIKYLETFKIYVENFRFVKALQKVKEINIQNFFSK